MPNASKKPTGWHHNRAYGRRPAATPPPLDRRRRRTDRVTIEIVTSHANVVPGGGAGPQRRTPDFPLHTEGGLTMTEKPKLEAVDNPQSPTPPDALDIEALFRTRRWATG